MSTQPPTPDGPEGTSPQQSAQQSDPRPDPAPHDEPTRRPHRRRLVAVSVVAAVLLAGGGTYAAQSLIGGGSGTAADGRDAPAPLRLDGFGTEEAADSGAAEPAPGATYRLTGDAPKAPDTAPVYRTTGEVAEQTVAALAKALGIDGKPTRQDEVWLVKDRDGAGPALRVSGTDQGQRGQWTFSRFSRAVDPKCGKLPQPDKPPRCPSLGGNGGEPAGPDTPVSSDDATGTSAETTANPDPGADGEAGPPARLGRPEAAPPQDGPGAVSEEKAKRAAAPVLTVLGLAEARLDASATTGALRTVRAEPRLDGLPVSGWDTSITVGSDGAIARGHGALAQLAKGDDYPVLSAERTLKELNSGNPGPADIRCVKAPCTPADGKGGAVDVKSAVFGLAAHTSDGRQLLVPSWRFTTAGGQEVSHPAVDPRHLAPPKEEPASRSGDGSAPGEPGDVEPAEPGDSGRTVESYRASDRTLTVNFWGGACSDYTARATETDSTVRITLEEREREPGGVCIKIAKSLNAEVELAKPIGDRDLVDERGTPIEPRKG